MFESTNSVEPLEAEDRPKARRGLFRAEPIEPVNASGLRCWGSNHGPVLDLSEFDAAAFDLDGVITPWMASHGSMECAISSGHAASSCLTAFRPFDIKGAPPRRGKRVIAVHEQRPGRRGIGQREERKYYSDYHQKHMAITATDKAIRTHLSDPKTVSAVVDLAKARGWESIRAKGTDEFKAEVWIEGSLRGIKVEGYTPNETNKQELARRQAQQSAQSAPTTQAVPVQAAKPQAKAAEDLWAAKAANGAAIAKKSGRVRTQTNGVSQQQHA